MFPAAASFFFANKTTLTSKWNSSISLSGPLLINTARLCFQCCECRRVCTHMFMKEINCEGKWKACSRACNVCSVFAAQGTSRRHPIPNDSLLALVLAQQALRPLHSAPWLHWPSVHLAIDSYGPAKHSVRPAAFLNSFNQSCLSTGMTTLLGHRLGNLTSWITPCFPGETEQLEQSHRSQGAASSLRLRGPSLRLGFSYWYLKLCKGVLCKMFDEVRNKVHKSIFTGVSQNGVECFIHTYRLIPP